MKNKFMFVECFMLLMILSIIFLPTVNAVNFDVGNRVSESDLEGSIRKWYTFDSGAMIGTNPDYIDYVQKIFDGNESTGIDYNFGSGHNRMLIYLVFPFPFNISNITFKPTFKGNSSEYVASGNLLIYARGVEIWFNVPNFVNKTIQLNFKVDTIRLWLDSNGTNHFSFNDVIINYTHRITDINESLIVMQNVLNSVNLLNNKFIYLSSQLSIAINRINNINNTVFNLNQIQQQISENISKLWTTYQLLNNSIVKFYNEFKNLNSSTFENITKLWVTYNQLNNSVTKLYKKVENINSTIYNNITLLENDLFIIQNEIIDFQLNLTNLLEDVNKIPEIQNQIDQTTFNINNLNENITEIKNTMPSEYDETTLVNRIIQLESENNNLKSEIFNNTAEIELLTSELEKIKTTDKEKVIEKEADNTVSYSAILLGILGIVIAILAITLLFKKLGKPPEPPIEEPRTEETPEQQPIPETETTTQEQIQETAIQETPQIEQQQGIG
jgi:hypothetical protein